MLAILTDAHISPRVAVQIKAKHPEISIHNLQEWRGGKLLDAEDEMILSTAWQDGLTLVTYDQSTITPLITRWALEGRDHAGVIFIVRSIDRRDIGGQIRALLNQWNNTNTQEWKNRVSYLNADASVEVSKTE